MVLFLIIAAIIIGLLLWKWLDVRSTDELTSMVKLLGSGNGQHVLSNAFQVKIK